MEGISIIVPVHNEEQNLSQLLKEFKQILPDFKIPYQLIFIDDGSQDKSRKILQQEKQLNIKLVIHKKRRGYGASLKHGAKLAQYNYICFLDSDCTQPTHLILEALPEVNFYQMLIGVRDERSNVFPLSQKIARIFISGLLSLIFRKEIKDINSGFRIIEKNCLQKYLQILPNSFSFSASLTLIMLLEKWTFKYLPFEVRKRKGYSKVKRTTYTFQFITCLILTYFKWLQLNFLR